ncbi:MAG: HNH endonuclease signature motif containing protein [Dehalococcoidia bacterium]|jgi:hypothetical protein
MRHDLLLDEAWMVEQYVNLEKSYSDIAKISECSTTTVKRYLRKLSIPIRSTEAGYSTGQRRRYERAEEHIKLSNSARTKTYKDFDSYVEKRRQLTTEKWKDPLYKSKIINGIRKSYEEHPERKEITRATAKRLWEDPDYRNRFTQALKDRWDDPEYCSEQSAKRIARWKTPTFRAKLSGPNSSNWRGGSSFEPYCPKFNEKLKESVRIAFNRTCVKCGNKENGKKLSCHHINFDKQSGCYGKPWNLIPLDHGCHSWTTMCRWGAFNLLINWWSVLPDINLRGFPFCELTLDANYNGLKF